MLAQKLLSGGAGEEKLYVDDVFQAFTRTGTGADVTVTTGIDMTKGYMLWSKGRSGATDHAIYDSARGVTLDLASNTTAAQTTQSTGLKAVSATGHTVGSLAKMNTGTATYVDFVFRKAPKFFDVVTYTGNGATLRDIPHTLGIKPGMVVIKCLDTSTGWATNHMVSGNNYLLLNTTDSANSAPTITYGVPYGTNTNATTFSVAANGSNVTNVNTDGYTYVAYLFAHDTSTDGLIQCGSFTTNGSGNAAVSLGWEPQYLLVKRTDSATSGSWFTLDTMRGWSLASDGDNWLYANTTTAENGGGSGANYFNPTSTGFDATSFVVSGTFIYMAIRRPNKPPTVGTQVYKGLLHSATQLQVSKTGVGFAPDVFLSSARSQSHGNAIQDRLRGANRNLLTHSSGAEVTTTQAVLSFDIDGVTLGSDDLHQFNYGGTYVEHFFKRAPGVMTQICYAGSGSNKTEAHDLTVPPEFWIVKGRSGSTQWVIGSSLLTSTEKIVMPTPSGKVTDSTVWNSIYPTSSVISLGSAAAVNTNAATYSCWMWATKPGISKVFSYTGNGSSQNIDCGFTTGARFILIVRTSAAGSVYVWDSVRGIISGNDPYLALDTTATEVTTDDSVDPLSYGFSVNQVAASNINVTSATYIGIAYS